MNNKREDAVAPMGGQAVIEGVMMRGKAGYAIALQKKNGKITTDWFPHASITTKNKIFAYPFIRGVVALFSSMVIGIKALLFSASNAEIDETDIKKKKRLEKEKSKSKQKAEKIELSGFSLGLMVLFSFVMGLGLFVALPSFLLELTGLNEKTEPIFFNIVSGVVRITMFVLYIFLISFMKDIKRVFQYHGAEHKVVNAFEAGKEITLNNVKKFTTFHPRCGTSFMFFVFVVAIAVFAFVPIFLKAIWPWFSTLENVIIQKLIIIPLHIAMLPLVAGLAYELIRITWRKRDSVLFKVMMLPGKGLQRITTSEPDDMQLKVSMQSIKEAIRRQEEADKPKKVAPKKAAPKKAAPKKAAPKKAAPKKVAPKKVAPKKVAPKKATTKKAAPKKAAPKKAATKKAATKKAATKKAATKKAATKKAATKKAATKKAATKKAATKKAATKKAATKKAT